MKGSWRPEWGCGREDRTWGWGWGNKASLSRTWGLEPEKDARSASPEGSVRITRTVPDILWVLRVVLACPELSYGLSFLSLSPIPQLPSRRL